MDARAGRPARAEGCAAACAGTAGAPLAEQRGVRDRRRHALAWAVDQKPEYRDAAKRWTLAAIDYEPWGYTYNKPNVDLAAGHLLYAIGWAYDLLYHELTEAERARVRASLERHAALVYDYFRPGGGQRGFSFTQNHNFIPTAGLAVTALALMGESADAPKWAALARAHHHRAGQLLSPDGYYYEGMEYWIFSAPWLVHFLDAWEHSTGESLWSSAQINHWKYYLAHVLLPDGQNVFDFGDIWEGPLTRARGGAEYDRIYPGGTLQSNFNALYRVAARLQDREAQAVAARYASFKHSNLEEYMTLLWRDPQLRRRRWRRFRWSTTSTDSGVVFARTSWESDATAFAFKAGPPEGHRVARLLPKIPEWKLSSGHAHPDANSFIIWARGQYLTGDTGYSGLVSARQHNTVTVGGLGQGVESEHDVWRSIPYATLGKTRIVSVGKLTTDAETGSLKIVGDATSSYPASAALTRFQRTFTFHAPDRFTIEDIVETSAPKTIEVVSAHRRTGAERRRPLSARAGIGLARYQDRGARGLAHRAGTDADPRAGTAGVDREGRRRAARLRAEDRHAAGDVDENDDGDGHQDAVNRGQVTGAAFCV